MSSINMNNLKIENVQNLEDESLDDSLFETNVNYFENRRNMAIYKGKRFKKAKNAVSKIVKSSNNAEKISTKPKINASPTTSVENLSINTSVWSSDSIVPNNVNNNSYSSFISLYPIYFTDCSAKPLTSEDNISTKPTIIDEDEGSRMYIISHHNNCPACNAENRQCSISDNSDHLKQLCMILAVQQSNLSVNGRL
ncbi:hypothetical protein HELRODRAFT_172627 [Helobdella robusta]|uniref:Uncharacterized protein n=1 Tax=Helobdella robusta TaxID=6412 RepID=T1F5N8_HELRO|nr:hypothetical protein HELRODRAFT_172627 [Helobdella robusta]ESO04270.1 hypothetical protein HELRODRAFT_172627 [Helobdella robusta]